ncbi:MAG TPA: methyltransferase domain-containing protein [Pyrinomonadaceae bacterium]|nr:methyltransferase domain-containing protein [Pyrinomonadaceae bacterium]
MSTNTSIIDKPLPREMQQHTYAIMRRVEESHWWYLGRRRIIRDFVESISPLINAAAASRDGAKARPEILDVGCGTGANLEMLSEFGDASGVDVSAEAVAFCHARGLENVKQAVAEALPFEDGSFELVTSLDVVEHLDDDVAGLKEMRRVLRADGRVLLVVPAFMFLWGVQDDVSNHRRRYTLPQLRKAVLEAGFEIERASYWNISFFVPTLLGRILMRATGVRPESEANITPGFLNGMLGMILGAESSLLRHVNLPFGVSIVCVARRIG